VLCRRSEVAGASFGELNTIPSGDSFKVSLLGIYDRSGERSGCGRQHQRDVRDLHDVSFGKVFLKCCNIYQKMMVVIRVRT
jgi:hypothetical protein